MRIAPDSPNNACSFGSLFTLQDVCQAGVPFMSSNISSRKTRWVDFGKAGEVAQAGMATDSELNVVLRVVSAHAMRASLFASAQATTLECRRVSMARTQAASRPDCRSSSRM